MNIFEFIGAKPRTGNKVCQHVKHFDEVPDSKKSYPMIAQIKKDGVCALVAKLDDKVKIFSRVGHEYKNCENLCRRFQKYSYSAMDFVVYIAELCNDSCSLEELSGMVNPNRVKPLSDDQEEIMAQSYLSFHDAIPLIVFAEGKSSLTYHERYRWLAKNLPIEFDLIGSSFVMDAEDAKAFTDWCIDRGEEGAVFKQNEDWQAGHKGYRSMKMVKGVDYDLLCIGAEEGKGKYAGLVANLIFRWKGGKQIKAMLGKGWTHDMAEEMWKCYTYGEAVSMPEHRHVDSPVGKIFQVYALQESSKGKLRLPKVGELRHDKDEPDI